MDPVIRKLHRLSPNQLRALQLLAKNQNAIISSTESGKALGLQGKALGGVYSSLSRQKIQGKYLIMPWGRTPDAQGLRWKLNEELVTRSKLLQITKDLLAYE